MLLCGRAIEVHMNATHNSINALFKITILMELHLKNEDVYS